MQRIPILMTRPAGSNRRFLDRIAPDFKSRLEVVTSPLISIEPLDANAKLCSTDAAIFTSSNGVGFAPPGKGRRAYCVGQHTTGTAQSNGWDAVFAGADASGLVTSLRHIAPACDLVHFHGRHVRGNVVEQLQAAGMQARSVVVYDQVLQSLTEEALRVLGRKTPVLVPLFSPRTAKHFATLATAADHTNIIAMSDAVADECTPAGFRSVFVAQEPTAASMVKCLEKRLLEVCPG